MTQASLFDVEPVGAVRKDDPISSVDAARLCDAKTQRSRLLSILGNCRHGATTEDLERETGWVRNTIASRLAQMERDGLVYSLGMRVNGGGRKQKVWFAEVMVSIDASERYL